MIPDEALEAAHKAWRIQAGTEGTIFEYNLRAALEAAAPYIAAEAWDEGEQSGYVNHAADPYGGEYTNPYRSPR
jgi:hypothetical protein